MLRAELLHPLRLDAEQSPGRSGINSALPVGLQLPAGVPHIPYRLEMVALFLVNSLQGSHE